MLVSLARTSSAKNNHNTSPSDTEGNPACTIRLGWADITRDLGIVQTFSTFASESDIAVAEDVVNELIHSRFFEPTSGASPATESGGTLNLLGQEIADICARSRNVDSCGTTPKLTDTTVFTANKTSGNAATLNVVACIKSRVVVVANLPGRFARIKSAVKRLDLSRPELEVTCGIVTVTREGNLGRSIGKHVQDLSVCRSWLGRSIRRSRWAYW